MEPPLFLPEHTYMGRQRRWRLSEVLDYERALAGLPPHGPLEATEERWLSAAQMRERFGRVSDMWLWRRTRRQRRVERPRGRPRKAFNNVPAD
jgi:AT hook motif